MTIPLKKKKKEKREGTHAITMQEAQSIVARELEKKNLRLLLCFHLPMVVAIHPQQRRRHWAGPQQPLLQQPPPRRLISPRHHPEQYVAPFPIRAHVWKPAPISVSS